MNLSKASSLTLLLFLVILVASCARYVYEPTMVFTQPYRRFHGKNPPIPLSIPASWLPNVFILYKRIGLLTRPNRLKV